VWCIYRYFETYYCHRSLSEDKVKVPEDHSLLVSWICYLVSIRYYS